jgi:hypothetical protein
VRMDIGQGSLYVVQHHTAGDLRAMLEHLVRAIMEHREGRLTSLPSFFADIVVPGEDVVVRDIAEAEGRLKDLRDRHGQLVRHKLLVGHLPGQRSRSLSSRS